MAVFQDLSDDPYPFIEPPAEWITEVEGMKSMKTDNVLLLIARTITQMAEKFMAPTPSGMSQKKVNHTEQGLLDEGFVCRIDKDFADLVESWRSNELPSTHRTYEMPFGKRPGGILKDGYPAARSVFSEAAYNNFKTSIDTVCSGEENSGRESRSARYHRLFVASIVGLAALSVIYELSRSSTPQVNNTTIIKLLELLIVAPEASANTSLVDFALSELRSVGQEVPDLLCCWEVKKLINAGRELDEAMKQDNPGKSAHPGSPTMNMTQRMVLQVRRALSLSPLCIAHT
jgi:hypothetical protein